jgi:hypothetical protein
MLECRQKAVAASQQAFAAIRLRKVAAKFMRVCQCVTKRGCTQRVGGGLFLRTNFSDHEVSRQEDRQALFF